MCKSLPSPMRRGWRPPAYLAPLPHDTPKTKEYWESLFLLLNLRGTNHPPTQPTTQPLTSCPALCSSFFLVSTLCSSCHLLFPAFQSPFPEKMFAWGHAFQVSVFFFFYPLCSIIFFLRRQYVPVAPTPAFSAQPSLCALALPVLQQI